MSQTTLGDDDLFGEAAEEIRTDVESHLEAARDELPEAEEIWEAEADNVLGVLNSLRSALDAGEAEEHLRQAKKWYVMGERAEAFEDADDLAAEIEDLEALIESLSEVSELVGDLTGTVPELRSALEAFVAEETDGGDEADDATEEEEADDEADDATEEEEADDEGEEE